MADLTFILTTAGFNALVNPANTGTNAITIDRIGVSSVVLPGSPESNIGIVQLPNELKRIASFGGDVVGDNTIHVTIRDESPDVYALRTFGLYSAGGVLLAFYTQPTPIMEKAASSMLLLAADLQFTTPISAELVFGDTNFINPPATTERQGVVELATSAETATGTDATRAVTPFSLKALLTALLAGYSPTGHTHAAGDVVSGTFAVERLPNLAQAKIIGLVDALAGKAATVHTHAMSEITGLVAALGLKLAISDFTWQNLVGKPNVAVQGQDAVFRDIYANRGDGTGAIFFGGIGALRYLYSNGVDYEMPNGALYVNGGKVWTASTFNPGLKADLSGAQFTGEIRAPRIVMPTGADREISLGSSTNYSWVVRSTGDNFEIREAGDPAKVRMSISYPNGVVSFQSSTIYAGGYGMWHAGNFNPADKAPALHSHGWAQVTDKPNLVVNEGSSVIKGETGGITVAAAAGSGVGLGGWARAHKFAGGAADASAGRFGGYGGGDAIGFAFITAGSDPDAFLGANSLRVYPTFAAWGGNPLWHAGNLAVAEAATPSAAVKRDSSGGISVQDVRAQRSDGTGVVYLGAAGSRFLYWNGSAFELVGGHLYVGGEAVYTEGHINALMPAGVVHYLAATAVPAGMRALQANGAAVSRTAYARLFAVIGTTYGVGDGGTTFNLPDLRGVFPRGLDAGRGLDSGRTLNNLQDSQNKSHTHGIPARSSTGSNNGYVEDGDSDGIVRSTFTFYEGGSEARPVNEALLAVITY